MPVTLTGPALPVQAQLGFCAVCAASWKATAFETQADAVTKADKDPAPTTIALYPRGLPTPALAVAYGLVLLPAPPGSPAVPTGTPMIVPMPLCWTHLQAVSFTGSGLVLPSPAIPLLDHRNPRA